MTRPTLRLAVVVTELPLARDFLEFTIRATQVITEELASDSSKMLDFDPTVVSATFPFRSHAPQPHSEPSIKVLELVNARRKRCSEVARHSPDDRVDLRDLFAIQVVGADR